MDIKELDKKQLILLTLLITFVVSIATGIVTVSLMQKAPKNVPQIVNNVIQRTIEKVSTVETGSSSDGDINTTTSNQNDQSIVNEEVVVPIYFVEEDSSSDNKKEVGQGVIISDSGLILIDTSTLTQGDKYKVVLNNIDFNANVLKKFENGFTILKISKEDNISTDNTTSITEEVKSN